MKASLTDNHPGFFRVLLCVILYLPIVTTRVNDQKSDYNSLLTKKYTLQCPVSNCVYLPLIFNYATPYPIPEIDLPPGRWPHTIGQPLFITYRYLGELNDPSHRWRIAFQWGMTSWNSTDTPIGLYLYSESQNTIGMVYMQTIIYPAYTLWYAPNGVLLRAEVFGNYYWEDYYQWTDNQRRSLAAHEIGHLQGIGHIPRSYLPPALMWSPRFNDEREKYYVPQIPDIALVNQVYP
jgi:hypothetical protein